MRKNIVNLIFSMAMLTGFVATAEAATIYKTVDKDGNIIFTDVPPKDQDGAVDVSEQNVYTAPALPVQTAPDVASEAEDAQDIEAVTSYSVLTITAPRDDEPVRENAGNLTVVVNAEPGVDTSQGHRLQVLLDGQVAADAAGSSVSLSNVDRGTHVLTARVTDADGNVLITSAPVTFHMLRYSALMRRNAG